MKLEKLSLSKFEAFRPYSIKNVHAITGGGTETDGNGTHDEAGTNNNGHLDEMVTSNDGTSIRADKAIQ